MIRPFSFLVPLLLYHLLATAEKFWLSPDCQVPVVRAMNDARWTARELDKMLDNEEGEDISFIDPILDWFFGFTTAQAEHDEHVVEVQQRLQNIGALERTMTRSEAKVRIYCDNMYGWEPEDGSTMPQKWNSQDPTYSSTYMKHKVEGIYDFGEEMVCRHDDEIALAATTAFSARRDIQDGNDPIPNPVIDLCEELLKDLAATSGDAVTFPLDAFQEVSEIRTIAYTLVHELIHAPFIGGGTIDGHQIPSPSDTHVTDFGARSGYYTNVDGPHGVANLPGEYLGKPYLTITNPDSYMYLCMLYRFHIKGWKAEKTAEKRLILKWNGPEEGDAETEEWKKEVVDGTERWVWAVAEWDKTDPNWSEERTPAGSV